MTSNTTPLVKINKSTKVGFGQYLANRHEPLEIHSEHSRAHQDKQTGLIKHTYLHKQAFRRLAIRLRLGQEL